MPEPDPHGVRIEHYDDGSWTTICEAWPEGNRRHRIARMLRIARLERGSGWRCSWCRGEMPLFRRTDARFCGEGCRKRAARERRWRRETWPRGKG